MSNQRIAARFGKGTGCNGRRFNGKFMWRVDFGPMAVEIPANTAAEAAELALFVNQGITFTRLREPTAVTRINE